MEDVVGIKAKDRSGNIVAFMTWGRLFDPVEDDGLLKAVENQSGSFAGGPMIDFSICRSLLDVADHQYFFEGLLHFAWRPIPFGEGYEQWRKQKRIELKESGKDLFFLGAAVRR